MTSKRMFVARGAAALAAMVSMSSSASAQCLSAWVDSGNAPFNRAFFGAAYDVARDRIVLFGGQGGSAPGGNSGETWTYNGQWSLVANSGPSPRNSMAMVYDPHRQRCILFGGTSQSVLNGETWEWDGTAWSPVASTGPTPGPRSLHAMAFDTTRRRTVLFGGVQQNGTIVGETWEFDGTQWASVATTGPSARFLPTMGYDLLRGKTVLFGGKRYDFDTEMADTWEWDGTTWTQSSASGPISRAGATLSWDPISHDMLLVGGYRSNGGYLGDAWRYDGTAWTPEPTNDYGARSGHWAGFDWAHGKTVLVGGAGQPSTPQLSRTQSLRRTAPSIAAEPIGVTACRRSRVELSVLAEGANFYQWMRGDTPVVDGGPFSGANGPTLVIDGSITPLSEALTGGYRCIVSNDCGDSISIAANVTVFGCAADLDDGSGGGACDGAVTIDDLVFFLGAFEQGSIAGDLDDGSGEGEPDGAVTIEDLVFMLVRFEEGC